MQEQSPLLPKHMEMETVQFSKDLMSSSAVGQWPQDQSLTQILLCINPDDHFMACELLFSDLQVIFNFLHP